ncbi:MAG: SGNH/GDSL hydrolase family protein [Candidatus Nanohaloarchaea archaeon]
MAQFPSSYLKAAVVIVLGAFLFIIAAEFAATSYVCNFGSRDFKVKTLNYHEYDECGVTPRYQPHPYLSYENTPNVNTSEFVHNRYGFRGPNISQEKPDGTVRVALLGGSSTYSLGVESWKYDFARQLQEELQKKYDYQKIQVINAGVVGYTSWESLVNLEFKVLPLDPDLVVVYHGVNDVTARLVDSSRYRADNTGYRKVWGEGGSLTAQSTLIRLLGGYPAPGLQKFVSHPTDISPERLKDNPPTHFRRNIRNIATISSENNASVLLSTWSYTTAYDDYVASPTYQKGIREQNSLIHTIANRTKAAFYDFASDMPRARKYWDTGRHVNRRGAGLKGELFAEAIVSKGLLNDTATVR